MRRALVFGSGGREHALCWRLACEGEVVCSPGNPGTAGVAENCPVDLKDVSAAVEVARRVAPDLVVVGPEDPLILGVADALRESGFAVVGPGRTGAQLEGSKSYAKGLMSRAKVPTAAYASFQAPGEALVFCRDRFDAGKQVAVKASGPALGKGVVLCSSMLEAEDAIEGMMIDRELGDAASTVVIEDRLFGREFSLMCLCSGTNFRSLPVAQDYKRALDGDRGPNTGGMGSVCSPTWVSAHLQRQAEAEVIAPILRQMVREGVEFQGVLFAGLLVQDGQPYCLEYNVRFGDPEVQSIVRRVESGFWDALAAVAHGDKVPVVRCNTRAAVGVVIASEGYPGAVVKGKPVEIGAMPAGVEVFHASTARDTDGRLVTAGGRVLTISAEAHDVPTARSLAYEGVAAIQLEGMQFRSDIAADNL